MADPAEPTTPEPPAATPPPPPVKEPSTGFTQKDLDDQAAAIRKATEAQTQKQLLEQLGFDSVEAAKQFRETQEEQRKSELTDAQRLTEEANTAKAEAEAQKAEARREKFEASLTKGLLTLEGGGCRPDRVQPAITLGAAFMATSALEGEELLDATISHIREISPDYFGESSSNVTSSPTPTPSTPKPGSPAGAGDTPEERAKKRWEAAKAKRKPHKSIANF